MTAPAVLTSVAKSEVTMSAEHVCNICDPAGVPMAKVEAAEVKPNIRRLQNERFHVWRCLRSEFKFVNDH